MRFKDLKVCSCGLVISPNLSNYIYTKRHLLLLKKSVREYKFTNQYQRKFRNNFKEYLDSKFDEE
jgi:hypothetical protein